MNSYNSVFNNTSKRPLSLSSDLFDLHQIDNCKLYFCITQDWVCDTKHNIFLFYIITFASKFHFLNLFSTCYTRIYIIYLHNNFVVSSNFFIRMVLKIFVDRKLKIAVFTLQSGSLAFPIVMGVSHSIFFLSFKYFNNIYLNIVILGSATFILISKSCKSWIIYKDSLTQPNDLLSNQMFTIFYFKRFNMIFIR